MTDTPDHIKKKQLEIWLAKPPEERIRLTLQMNDDLFGLWNEVRKNIAQNNDGCPGNIREPNNDSIKF